MYDIEFSVKAAKTYSKLQAKLRANIDAKLILIAKKPYAKHNNVKPLKGMESCYRLRVGDWRVIYRIINRQVTIVIIKIAHRKEVYRT